MQQRPTAEDLEGTASPDSELSDDDNTMARQLALIMERLVILESRFDYIEERVVVFKEASKRTGQGSSSRVRSSAGSSSSTTAATINSSTPTTPVTARARGTCFQPSTPFLSPTSQHPSPRSVYAAHPADSQLSGQFLSQLTSMMQNINLPAQGISGSPRPTPRKRLPAHYFSLTPIPTPGRIELEMEGAAEGVYYVITQGIVLGAFQDWHTVQSAAKNVGGAWRRAETKAEAIEIYRSFYNKGLCRLLENV